MTVTDHPVTVEVFAKFSKPTITGCYGAGCNGVSRGKNTTVTDRYGRGVTVCPYRYDLHPYYISRGVIVAVGRQRKPVTVR